MRRLLESPWLYFGLAGALLVAAVASQFEIQLPGRPKGSVEDLRLKLAKGGLREAKSPSSD